MQENLKRDPKSFYKFANTKLNVHTGIGPLENSKHTYTNNPSEMASLLTNSLAVSSVNLTQIFRLRSLHPISVRNQLMSFYLT